MFNILFSIFSLLLGYFAPGFFLSFIFFRKDELSHAERIAISLAFSIVLIGVLMTFLGMTIGFSAFSTIALLLVISCLAYFARRHEINEFWQASNYSPALPRLTPFEGLVFFIVAFQIIMALYFSIFFPIDGGDALTFHAPLERLYAQAGSLVPAEGVLALYNPLSHGFHLFISWFYLLNGVDDLYARLASPILFASSCILLYSLAHRLFDRKTAALALLLFASTPLLLAHAQVAYINLPELFFSLAGFFTLMLALRQPFKDDLRLYLAAGILGGFAAMVKPSGLTSFALPALLLIFYFRRRASLLPFLALAAGALLSFSPLWFAANSSYYLDSSSTFYLFNPGHPHEFQQSFFFLFFDSQIALNQGIGPFFVSFGLVGFALLYANKQKRWAESFTFIWFIIMFIVSELFLLRLGGRFAMLAVPATSLIAAYGLNHLLSSKSRTIVLLAGFLLLITVTPFLAIGAIGFKSARISYETNSFEMIAPFPPPSHEAFLRFAYGPIMDGAEYLNMNTSASSHVLVNVPLTYLINRTIYQTSEMRDTASLFDSLRYLRRNGIDYVFLVDADVEGTEFANNPVEINIDNTWVFTKVYENSRTRIYKVINFGDDENAN
ncbi:MAG: glycosyltransferase family 39 protein [Candidatus Burarchaeum sp.]|nr:glycosyltransferase family 39 protein [Candidatus Burarchaeum sp.]MDO8339060.1 glycosyltransferase family 39 protein [Candidatus Burarchaeum sp.]